ncbi:MAG: phosphoribosyl-ATP diphosphatase [Thiotrichales bacterium]|jgi:phosphoribosyl-ATP pyrophosphohydrolase|nr:phosphoribosyl-ATP diphosphatase [Thiotrichales bacterium]
MENNQTDVLSALAAIIESRKNQDSKTSYVASLFHKGTDKICGKMAEECMETGLAAKIDNKSEIVYEMADLWFHCMVLLAHHEIDHQQVLQELARRFGVSGHVEKANRDSTN